MFSLMLAESFTELKSDLSIMMSRSVLQDLGSACPCKALKASTKHGFLRQKHIKVT